MKISLEWLGEFITWKESDPFAIADRITLSTAEVEEVAVQGALLDKCCVGEVTNLRQHPGADRLRLADVKTDKGMKTVVCGGTNLREGMLVAFAHVGAKVKHGDELVTLEPAKIRGEMSEGMICAAEEVGLVDMFPPKKEDGERPVIDLTRSSLKLKAGTSLRETLGLGDAVLDVNNTAITMRPDLFSHLGFARECVALGLAKWEKKPVAHLPTSKEKRGGTAITIDAKKLVPRYLGCTIEIDALGETPAWMKRRLVATGWRAVSLPVDITNYVSMEIGCPMHAFDADDIRGHVHLRTTKKGETIKTLDGKDRALPEGVLVLNDDDGVFDLVGIMGGLRGATKPTTRRLFVHALSLDPSAIRAAIIATGHRTEASTTYEKGVPAITTEFAFARAVELMCSLIPGARIASPIVSEGALPKPEAIAFSGADIRSALGADVSDADISATLESLEFAVEKKSKGAFNATPPLHRLRDMEGVHGITEEIGRIRGFDAVPFTMPDARLRLPKRDGRTHALRTSLKESGFFETVPLSFVSPAMLKKCDLDPGDAPEILNPLGEETSLLQTHTLPRLLVQAEKHLPNVAHDLMIFQCGRVFSHANGEHAECTALIAAKGETNLMTDPFLRVKTAAIDAAFAAGFALTVDAPKHVPAFAHPGRCAALLLGGKQVGLAYEIHPSVRARFDLPHRCAAVTIDLDALLAAPATIPTYVPLSRFPAVSYDVTLTRKKTDELGALLGKMRGADALLESVAVRDIYEGKPMKEGEYGLTLRFTYRSQEGTLTDDAAKATHEKVLKAANK